MAKCVRHYANGSIKRVSDKHAAELVKSGYYNYCPKKTWRRRKY